MRKLKRLALLLLLAAEALLASGCWDMVEINDRLCVRGIGLDVGTVPGMLRVTFQMLVPYETSVPEDAPRYQAVTLEAATVSEAVDLLAANTQEKPHFEHLAAIILGRELSQRPQVPVLDYFYRTPQVRRSCEVVAVNGTAESLLTAPIQQGGVGEYAEDLIKTRDRRGRFTTRPSTLSRIFVKMVNGEAYYLPVLDYAPPEEDPPEQEAEAVWLKPVGAMLYDDERHFAGTLDVAQMNLLQLLQGQESGLVLTLDHVGDRQARFSFRLEHETARLGCRVEGEHFVFPVEIRAECLLTESWGGTGLELGSEDFYREAESELEGYLARKVQELIFYTQQMGADAVGFSRLARQRHARWYDAQGRPWRVPFAAAEFPVTVQVTLKRGGHVE